MMHTHRLDEESLKIDSIEERFEMINSAALDVQTLTDGILSSKQMTIADMRRLVSLAEKLNLYVSDIIDRQGLTDRL